MDLIQIPHYAILSGLFGTAASVFGKFISYSDEVIEQLIIDSSQHKLIWNWSLKIICVVLMVLCNVIVWTFFVKALHQRGGSIVATVCSTATNYCGSAFFGSWIFGERISVLWWLGSTIVLIGLMLISLGQDNPENNTLTTQQKKD